MLALLPLLALRGSWRTRIVGAAAFVVPAVALMGAWTLHNGLRYDNYTLARGGNATVPFYRAFVTDKIVRPSNGPASRELAHAVQRDLLHEGAVPLVRDHLDRFFSEASSRMQEDLVALSDRDEGLEEQPPLVARRRRRSRPRPSGHVRARRHRDALGHVDAEPLPLAFAVRQWRRECERRLERRGERRS